LADWLLEPLVRLLKQEGLAAITVRKKHQRLFLLKNEQLCILNTRRVTQTPAICEWEQVTGVGKLKQRRRTGMRAAQARGAPPAHRSPAPENRTKRAHAFAVADGLRLRCARSAGSRPRKRKACRLDRPGSAISLL